MRSARSNAYLRLCIGNTLRLAQRTDCFAVRAAPTWPSAAWFGMSRRVFEVILAVIHATLLIVAIGMAVLVLMLLVEVSASLRSRRVASVANDDSLQASRASCPFVVVMPAHDECGTIERTLAATLPQMGKYGRVLVVADNCTDATAAVSATAGAEVIERHDLTKRGKGYALDFAMRHLAARSPDVVIILDADCTPTPGTIDRLVVACKTSHSPLQARYEMEPPEASASIKVRIGAFAWRVKNIVRPTGLSNLGLPCLLMGTGMAFPWDVIAKSHLETGHLVEDMVLGLELTEQGHAPRFLPDACVQSAIPPSVEGQTSQRARWETGHLQVIGRLVPRFLWRGLASANLALAALALHAAVPPLAFLALMLGGTTVMAALVALAGGSATALWLSLATCCAASAALTLCWRSCGRDLIPADQLILLPGYVLSKVAMYARALTGQKLHWVRSKRD